MSLYNQLFGYNKLAGVLLNILELDPQSIGRFRDCWWDAERSRIVIHTRTGGGNREAYMDDNARLATHPCYRGDCDSDYDSTYADFYFELPEKWAHIKDELDTLAGKQPSTADRWDAAIKAIGGTPPPPGVALDQARVQAAAESLAQKLKEAFDQPAGDGPNIIEV